MYAIVNLKVRIAHLKCKVEHIFVLYTLFGSDLFSRMKMRTLTCIIYFYEVDSQFVCLKIDCPLCV